MNRIYRQRRFYSIQFHHEHKVSKYIQMFSKVYCFLACALSLFVDHVS